MILQNYHITENDTPSRLDRYLKRQISYLNQSALQKWIRSKDIKLNGHKTAADASLTSGDNISLSKFIVNILSQPQEPVEFSPSYKQADMEFFENMIVYDDDDFLILNKPAGLEEPSGNITIDDMFRQLAIPMIKSWIDQNMPTMIEALIEKEIKKITENN